ncbi:hypothetical protein LDENG_00058420 [Lucifuga dentata]|nr:hypothetical protein LDENG_00058420 [Lucifuga dentata]
MGCGSFQDLCLLCNTAGFLLKLQKGTHQSRIRPFFTSTSQRVLTTHLVWSGACEGSPSHLFTHWQQLAQSKVARTALLLCPLLI